MTPGIAVGLLIVLITAAWAVRPLLAARRARQALPPGGDEQLENLLFQRESVLVALRDLQMDQEMGKLNAEDFAALDAQYRAQAIAVLRALDDVDGATTDPATLPEEEALERWIERAVAAARGGTGPVSAA